jgi:hypothetical protein
MIQAFSLIFNFFYIASPCGDMKNKKTNKKNHFYSKKLSLFSGYLFLRIRRRGFFFLHQNFQKIFLSLFSGNR